VHHADLAPDDVTFYHSFDGHSVPDFALGSAENVFAGRMAFGPGFVLRDR